MEDIRRRYDTLVREFREKEEKLVELRAAQKEVETGRKKVETQLKALLKLKEFSEKAVGAGLDRLDKELNTRVSTLSERLAEYESTISEVKSGGESVEVFDEKPPEELNPIDSLLKEDD